MAGKGSSGSVSPYFASSFRADTPTVFRFRHSHGSIRRRQIHFPRRHLSTDAVGSQSGSRHHQQVDRVLDARALFLCRTGRRSLGCLDRQGDCHVRSALGVSPSGGSLVLRLQPSHKANLYPRQPRSFVPQHRRPHRLDAPVARPRIDCQQPDRHAAPTRHLGRSETPRHHRLLSRC